MSNFTFHASQRHRSAHRLFHVLLIIIVLLGPFWPMHMLFVRNHGVPSESPSVNLIIASVISRMKKRPIIKPEGELLTLPGKRIARTRLTTDLCAVDVQAWVHMLKCSEIFKKWACRHKTVCTVKLSCHFWHFD
jgi:hypothetical protein